GQRRADQPVAVAGGLVAPCPAGAVRSMRYALDVTDEIVPVPLGVPHQCLQVVGVGNRPTRRILLGGLLALLSWVLPTLDASQPIQRIILVLAVTGDRC